MAAVISLDNVTKKFGKRTVFANINLKIEKGSVMGLIGQSGSGKTTLIKIILGIYKPTSGRVCIDGGKNFRIGFASQDYSFYPRLTVLENLSIKENRPPPVTDWWYARLTRLGSIFLF